jgi:hypothetical protein
MRASVIISTCSELAAGGREVASVFNGYRGVQVQAFCDGIGLAWGYEDDDEDFV